MIFRGSAGDLLLTYLQVDTEFTLRWQKSLAIAAVGSLLVELVPVSSSVVAMKPIALRYWPTAKHV